MREEKSLRDLTRRFVEDSILLGTERWILDGLTRQEALRLAAGAERTTVAGGSGGAGAVTSGSPPAASSRSGSSAGPTTSEPPAEIEEGTIRSARDLEELSRLVAACTRCPLHRSRTNPVFGEGDPAARVVCVGEAPGAREDETGRPFVGRAGQLLDRLLLTIGLPRPSVYICNVLKSRPPRNRDPLPEEVEACTPFLLRQLALIDPEVVVAFGAFAARTLLERKDALGRMRGTVHEYAGFPVVVTYHPAALLRNPGWTRATWEDLQLVRRLLDGERGIAPEGEGGGGLFD